LKRKAAPGVDGVTWKEYETGWKSTKRSARPGSPRSVPGDALKEELDTEDQRQNEAVGIAALEDKIVQHAVVTVLNQIYEEDFRNFSYGFRPGRRPHMALDALYVGLKRKKVNWVLDMDLKGFFDNLEKERLMEMVEQRMDCRSRMQRLIRKWLNAGVIEDGKWSETEKGLRKER